MGLDDFIDGKPKEIKVIPKVEEKVKPSRIPYWWKSYKNYRTVSFEEGIKDVPNKIVDLILTTLPDDIDIVRATNIILECNRVLKDGNPAIVFFDDTKLYGWADRFKNMDGYQYQHLMKWYRESGQTNYEGFLLYKRTSLAFLLTKGKANASLVNRKIIPADTISCGDMRVETINGIQITQPTELYRMIISAFTKERNIVLDPFLGYGTTLRVCNIINRLGLGFLNDPGQEGVVKANAANFTMRIDGND